MKVALQKVYSRDKTKKYLTVRIFKGYKVVEGEKKQDKSRESTGLFIWVNPENNKQRQLNKESLKKAEIIINRIKAEYESGLYNIYNPENRKINFTDYWLEWADNHCSGQDSDSTRIRSNFSQFKTS